MTFEDLEWWMILDILLLLLIGMGPKIALVPFMEMTADLSSDVRKRVATKMVRTATTWAIILVLLGALLMRLFHFSEEALYIAGGIVFFLLALNMLLAGSKHDDGEHKKISAKEAESMALYPLAVPYLLNPVGITMFIIFSASIDTIPMHLLFIVLILLMALFDWFLFTHLDKFMKHLDKSRLAVTEAIFGVILAALAIELVLRGLSELGIIEKVLH